MTAGALDRESAAGHLEGVLGYRIADLDLLETALTHPSYASENPRSMDYQRLEFLGDAVLELAVTSFIYDEYPTATEGEMTLLRAAVVSEPALAAIAESWGLPNRLLLGRGEELSGGRGKHSILSDVVEALLAAVYLDAGLRRANQIVRDHWAPMIHERAGTPGQRDFKTRLQERLVAAGRTIEYTVTETGPQHAKHFAATVSSSGEDLARGSGTSKKRAEQDAARKALELLDETEAE
jgi:ribonuclease-3